MEGRQMVMMMRRRRPEAIGKILFICRSGESTPKQRAGMQVRKVFRHQGGMARTLHEGMSKTGKKETSTMPKLKSNRGAAKRFKKTASGASSAATPSTAIS
jgi:hypothetical protein